MCAKYNLDDALETRLFFSKRRGFGNQLATVSTGMLRANPCKLGRLFFVNNLEERNVNNKDK